MSSMNGRECRQIRSNRSSKRNSLEIIIQPKIIRHGILHSVRKSRARTIQFAQIVASIRVIRYISAAELIRSFRLEIARLRRRPRREFTAVRLEVQQWRLVETI